MRVSRCVLPIFLVLAFSSGAFAQAELPKGKIVPKVVCLDEPSQSYTLYLPSNYTPDRKWPVLYAFDPGAQGLLPVGQFQAAAEKYGYVVVASNNSRNGPGVPLKNIVENLLNDTSRRFSLDDKRIYTTGFSGGARIATGLGEAIKGKLAGVVACGAGFPMSKPPEKPPSYAFFGTVGNEDFNYFEMRYAEKAFENLPSPNYLAIFDGPHQWAPRAICMQAIEWMEIQAMKSGRAPRNDKLIEELFTLRLEKARAHEQAGELPKAWYAYMTLARDFSGLRDTAEQSRKADELKNSKAVKEFFKQEKDQERIEEKRSQQYSLLKFQLKDRETRPVALAEIRAMIQDLKNLISSAKEKNSSYYSAKRMLTHIGSLEYEGSIQLRYDKNYEDALTGFEIRLLVTPNNPYIHYQLAWTHAAKGDKKKALEQLRKAAETGFPNAAEIENNRDFDLVRNEPGYRDALEILKRNQSKPGS